MLFGASDRRLGGAEFTDQDWFERGTSLESTRGGDVRAQRSARGCGYVDHRVLSFYCRSLRLPTWNGIETGGIAGFSYSTAVGLVSTVVSLVFLLATNLIVSKVGETSLF